MSDIETTGQVQNAATIAEHDRKTSSKKVSLWTYDASTDTSTRVGPATPLSTIAGATAIQIDQQSATLFYLGKAAPGTATSSATWLVEKLDLTGGLSITYADGNSNYDNVWDNHLSLSYS